jgi:hypothetical protein
VAQRSEENNMILSQDNHSDEDNYKKFLSKLAVDTCSRVFSLQFMNNFNLNPDSNVTIMSGRNLDPRLFGYNGNVPEAKFYTFFYIVPKSMKSN